MTEIFRDPFAPGQARPGPLDEGYIEEPREDTMSFGDVAGDLLAAPFRGLEGAGRGILGLADSAVEAFGGDLGDFSGRSLGRSETIVGGLIEGATQFFVGFLPAVGLLSKAGKIGVAAQAAAKTSGAVKTAKAIEVGRFAAAGALADATVFDGHEGRLSDFIQAHPALENPVTELLASGENDSQAEGRFKNALEGLGLGVAIDMLLPALRAMKTFRKELAGGATREAASEAAQRKLLETDLDRALAGDRDTVLPENPTDDDVAKAIDEEGSKIVLEDVEKANARQLQEKFPELADEPKGPSDSIVPRALREIGLEEADADAIWAKVQRRNAKDWPADINPREMVTDEFTGERHLRYSDADLTALEINRGDLNLGQFGNLDGTQMIRVLEGLYQRVYDADLKVGETVGLQRVAEDAAREVASAVGTSTEELLAVAGRGSDIVADARKANIRIQAFRTTVHMLGNHAAKLGRELKTAAGDSTSKRLEFLQSTKVLIEATGQMKALSAEQSRILGNNRTRIPGADFADGLTPDNIEKLLGDSGGSTKQVDKLVDRLLEAHEASNGGALGVSQLLEQSYGSRFLAATNEVFIQSVLSGGKTLSINAIGGLVTAVYRPLEIMLGAAAHATVGGGGAAARAEVTAAFREFTEVLRGLTTGVTDTMRLGLEAYKADENRLAGGRNTVLDPGLKTGAVNQGLLPPQLRNGAVGSTVDWIGRNIIRQPTRLLGAADEALKVLTYRAVTQASLTREALERNLGAEWATDQMGKMIRNGVAYSKERLIQEGIEDAKGRGILDPIKVAQHAQEFAEANFDENLSSLSDYALNRAADATFTERLEKGTLGRSVQDFIDQHPYLRTIAPFIRTPTNLLKFVGRRLDYVGMGQLGMARLSPLAAKRLESSRRLIVRDLTSNDPRAKADAFGRLTAGTAISTTAFMYAAEGKITGAGPADPEQRRLLQQTGWQPFSIKVGDGYVQYQRLDPFASFLGLTADIVEYGRWAGPEQKGLIGELATAVGVALTHNITEKSYFQGISQFLSALTQPERHMPKLRQRYAAAFIPNVLGQSVTPQFDDQLKDVRSVVDAMRAKIPGLSEDIAPYRNVLGETVHRSKSWGSGKLPILDSFLPFAYRASSDSVVDRELAALGHGFTPASPIRNEQNLHDFRSASGQSAYDRWGELQGQVTLGGKTLRESLRKLFRSGAYRRLPEPDAFEGLQSPRIAEVNKVINTYRRAAYRQTLREYPELNSALQERHERRRAARLGLVRQ
jgi:hypothetical protein